MFYLWYNFKFVHYLWFCFKGYTLSCVTSVLNIPTFTTHTLVSSINGWITIQQRIDGSTSFNRPWVDYRNGFGSCSSNCWFGLEKIYQMMQLANYKLRFELQLSNGTWRSAEYTGFKLDNEAAQYTIHVSGFIGDTWDIQDIMNSPISGGVHNGRPFTTTTCFGGGGWWWDNCCYICANAPYPPGVADYKNKYFHLNILRMMMKQVWSFNIQKISFFETSTLQDIEYNWNIRVVCVVQIQTLVQQPTSFSK